ncbi:helix-turn-helix domain-containing protein [Streptosporangium lutulentum]
MELVRQSRRAYELGAFLRSRRTLLRPGEVGLSDEGVRRTSGLRREETARLAGVSEGYYVRLEQGRAPHPSASVLGALAARCGCPTPNVNTCSRWPRRSARSPNRRCSPPASAG